MTSQCTPPVSVEGRSSNPKALVAHFLLQVQICHARSRDREPSPLHFDSATGEMVQYLWPVDPVTGQRLAPSEFESYRRTHELRAPCCLCAFIDGKAYTEARIGIAEALTQDLTRSQSTLNGEIVAVCEKQRCGYFLCLERFYPLRGLRSRVCPERRTPLNPEDVTLPIVDVDDSFRAGEGLFQVMTDAVIRGRRTEGTFRVIRPQKTVKPMVVRRLAKGIPEEQFWATFVQCLFCQAVIFRETYGANHVCDFKEPQPTRRYSPYTPPAQSTSAMRTRVAASRLQRSYAMAIIPASPTLTIKATDSDMDERSDFEGGTASGYETSDEAGQETDTQDSDSESHTDAPVLSSDFELPSLSELLGL